MADIDMRKGEPIELPADYEEFRNFLLKNVKTRD